MNIHLYPSPLKNETRMLKIARSLRKYCVFNEIRMVGVFTINLPAHEYLGNGIHIHRIAPIFGSKLKGNFGKLVRTLGWSLAVLIWARKYSPICLNCHSLPVLPLSIVIKAWKRCKLVYDTHELETETNGSRGLRNRIGRLVESNLIHCCDAICVVNPSYASWYENRYGLRGVCVVRNFPTARDTATQRSGLLRNKINIDPPDALLFIYQGVLAEGRGIHNIIEVFKSTNGKKNVVFMGYGPLEAEVKRAAKDWKNIYFLPAVDPEDVKNYTVDADIGLCLIENTCLSYYLCAPNKLFEYVACGVPVVVSDFPEMRGYVDKNNCGWSIEPSVSSLRELIEYIDVKTLSAMRNKTSSVIRNFVWESEVPALLNMYQTIGLFNQLDEMSGFK